MFWIGLPGSGSPRTRRLADAGAVAIGLVVAVVLRRLVTLGLAAVAGWDAAALTFLAISWAIILRADGARTQQLAIREDETKGPPRRCRLNARGWAAEHKGEGLMSRW